MNLRKAPKLDDLKELFARRKDKNDHHVLWVCETGQVHLESLPAGVDPETFERSRPSMRLRLKTYNRGAGYVGRHAAADEHFIRRVYDCLLDHWPQVQQRRGVAYVDRYC